jgi:hypothetical protein
MEFFAWWFERPWWLRWLVALIPIAIGLVRLAMGWFWPWAFAVGGVLVLINLYLLLRKKKPHHDSMW